MNPSGQAPAVASQLELSHGDGSVALARSGPSPLFDSPQWKSQHTIVLSHSHPRQALTRLESTYRPSDLPEGLALRNPRLRDVALLVPLGSSGAVYDTSQFLELDLIWTINHTTDGCPQHSYNYIQLSNSSFSPLSHQKASLRPAESLLRISSICPSYSRKNGKSC